MMMWPWRSVSIRCGSLGNSGSTKISDHRRRLKSVCSLNGLSCRIIDSKIVEVPEEAKRVKQKIKTSESDRFFVLKSELFEHSLWNLLADAVHLGLQSFDFQVPFSDGVSIGENC